MSEPARQWWSPAEIAAAELPELPATSQAVTRRAQAEGWRDVAGKARRRYGRGGGWEYHWTLFPAAAQRALSRDGAERPGAPVEDREAMWARWEALPARARARAEARLAAIRRVEALEAAGLARSTAVEDVARADGVGARTVWGWIAAVDGVPVEDRLPHLAPRHREAARTRSRGVDPAFGALIKADYLRLERPSLSSVYDRAVRVARARGIEVAPLHTVRRWLKREVSPATLVLARKGDALKAMCPARERDMSALRPLDCVTGVFRRFHVFVRWPAEPGEAEGRIERPQMVAFQDVYSGRLLSWRVDRTPNHQAVQLALGDLIETWGIPEKALLDNGREFAAKAITGGAPNRYRFSVREDDIPGLLTSVGCEVIWATPYSGQSKPIERAFLDLCDRVAKHPRFAGAYTGHRPDAKPENYRERAVELDDFLAVLAEEIEHHNTRRGRRSEVAWGRSFAEVFDEAYARVPIRKATEAQRRLWLMGAEGLRVSSREGSLRLMRNRYHDHWLAEHAGEKVVARFDPAALWDGIHVYALSGEYLGHAPCVEKSGFLDVEEGRRHARARAQWMRAEKAALAAHRRMTAAELADALDETAPEAPAAPVEAKVVRATPPAGSRRVTQAPPEDPEIERAQSALILDMEARRARAQPSEDDEMARFRRALEMEARAAAGEGLTTEQRRWLGTYQGTPEYQAHRMMLEDFGESYLAE